MNDTNLDHIAALAAPLGDSLPCGENLEYDPRFLALEEAARGKPEVQYGSTITQAEPPDWKTVRELALALSAQTRDLRVAVYLTRALLPLEGWPGFAAGLALLASWLAAHWESVHPQLDPEDDHDPALRINTLAMLLEPAGMLRELRARPLVEVRAVGSFALDDIEAEGGDNKAAIDAAFRAAEPRALADTRAALESAAGSVRAIEAELAARLAAGTGLDTGPLAGLLGRALQAVEPYLHVAPDVAAGEAATAGAADLPAQPAAPRDGEVASRADVVRHLERLCAWYARHEPASPVPLLLRRAIGLVDKNFTELLQELAPDGLTQLAVVSGVRNES